MFCVIRTQTNGLPGDDWEVKVWTTHNGALVKTLNPELGPGTAIELFIRNLDRWLILGGASGTVQVWYQQSGEVNVDVKINVVVIFILNLR